LIFKIGLKIASPIEDMTTQEGVETAKKSITDAGGVFLRGSLPCTAGTPWNSLNERNPGGKARIRAHRRLCKKLIGNFRECALLNKSLGGMCGFEWPKDCSLWKQREVANLRRDIGLLDVVFDGCSLGLVSHHGADAGLPIKKPWRVATDMATLREALRHYTCPGKQEHPRHSPCAGADTTDTGFYTNQMVDVIHKAFAQHMSQQASPAAAALCEAQRLHDAVMGRLSVEKALLIQAMAAQAAPVPVDPLLEQARLSYNEEHAHRPRLAHAGVWNAMVTTALHPSDPRARSDKALAAIEEELTALREEKAWREHEPMEADAAAKLHADAHFATLHSIVGIKNAESPNP
jgi:hypothetical protein